MSGRTAINAAHKARRAEHCARALLEAAGFTMSRAAGSKGLVDLVTWDPTSIKFISVSGSTYASAIEREGLMLMPRPVNSCAEIWRFPDRRGPVIERL
jgi:hypothetical protein